jgi:hypothetical protein
MIVEEKSGYRIRDRRGRPEGRTTNREMAIGNSLFATPRSTQQTDFYRQRQWGASNTTAGEMVDPYDWTELLEFSRQLVAQRGNLGAAVLQKNLYAVGRAWQPHYMGKNEKWGEAASEWLREVWYPQCDARGSVFDFTTNLLLSGIAYDVDGDDVAVFVTDDNGFPKVRHYPAHCIGSGTSGAGGEVKGGWADGAKICNGIILDRDDQMIGVRILDGSKSKGANAYLDVPSYNCDLRFEPEWRSLSRGVPRVGKMCMDWFDVEDIDLFLKRGVKLDAAQGIVHWTESGEAPTGTDLLEGRGNNGSDTNVVASDIKIEKRMGGEILYMRAGKGEKLESFRSDRPHPNAEAFIARCERRGLLGIGWFYELLDPSKIGGASVRLIQDQARTSICNRQGTLCARAKRKVGFAVGQGMATGRIPPNHDGVDFLKWGFHMPPVLTVDQGYDEQADRENLKIGSTTLAAICEKKGAGSYEAIRLQRKKENFNLIECAVELVAYAKSKGQDLTFREAIDLMQREGANARPQTLPDQAELGPKQE